MPAYKKDWKRVDAAMRRSGVVVVMNKDHIKKPEDMVVTMQEVYKAGLVAECTFRIEEGILREGMQELVKLRAESPADNPFVLGVGSVINPKELEAAISMGFDMVVAPANVMGGYGEGKDFIRVCHDADIFASPAVFTPTEFQYFIERDDGLEPDAIKVFPARVIGPKGLSDLLAPMCATATPVGSSCLPAPSTSSRAHSTRRLSPSGATSRCWGCRRRWPWCATARSPATWTPSASP